MEDRSPGYLHFLQQLALEYQHKYKELEEFVRSAEPEKLVHQLRLRAELTTDRFRAAQQALLAITAPADSEAEEQEVFRAALALCRCFDEMRILFQILLERSSGPDKCEG